MAQHHIPLELQLLEQALDDKFNALIVGVGNNQADQRKNYLSKAVAAFALVHEAGATPQQAAQSIVDGGMDNGLDAIFVAADDTLWLIQTKFISSGSGEPELGDVGKFRDGVIDLLACNYHHFNEAVNAKAPEITAAMDRGGCRVKVVLAYTGTALSEDKRRILSGLENNYNATNPGFVRCFVRGLSSLHGFQQDEQAAEPIPDEEILLKGFGYIDTPYRGYYGRLSAKRLAELEHEYGDRIVEKNIRRFRGSTVVNEGILETLKEEPDHFFYFNNGVTFLCDNIQQRPPFDPSRQNGRFILSGLSVINGAQTVGSIAQEPPAYYDDHPAEVLAVFVNLENTPDNFAELVTQYRNRQNAVDLEDFAGLDERQEGWKATLELAGITYLHKRGDDDPPASDTVFSVQEAAPALACCRTTADWADYIVAAKSERKRLFRRPEFSRPNDLLNNAYMELFRDSLTARELWRAVQVRRIVERAIKARASGEQNPAVAEILRQGVWLSLHILFLKTRLQDGDTLELTIAEKTRISITLDAIANELATSTQAQNFNKQYRSVFENKSDCQTIKNAMMAALTQAL